MKIRGELIFIYSLIFIFTFWHTYSLSQNRDPHNFSGRCEKCHLGAPDKGKKLIFTRDESTLCYDCHKDVAGLSHPVGVRASMEVPPEFPLDWKKEITCITCHVAHGYNSKTDRYLMRKNATGEIFCRSCHDISIEGISLHRGVIDTAHVGSRYREENRLNYIDDFSMKCLSCHDAVLGGDSMIEFVGSGSYSHDPVLGVSHPIGAKYVETGAYVKLEDLDKRIKLFDGKVGCGSCHSPYSNKHYQLVMSNENSKLCFACHKK